MITIRDSTTVPTVMNAHRERLSDFCATDASLTCATRIDFHDQPTSILRFVGQHVYESRYRDIEHRLAQPPTGKPFDVQIFNCNKAVSINQFPRFFVMKVVALIPNVIVKASEQKHCFTPPIRSAFPARNTPLKSPEFRLCRTKPTRVFDLRPVAQRSEVVNADVHADHVRIERQWSRFVFDGEQCKPAAGLSLNSQCFYVSDQRPMLPDTHNTNFGNPHLVLPERIAYFAKCKTAISVLGFEPRVARFLSVLYTSKERLKGQVDALKGVLNCLCLYGGYVFAEFSYFGNLQILIEPRDRFALERPGVASLLKRGIVKLAADSQLLIQGFFLPFGGIDPVAERPDHPTILPVIFSLSEESSNE